jgi:arsenate reductase (glutaredoxin)
MSMVHIYGIANCGSVKKAFSWFSENNIKFQFHDFKNELLTANKIKEWLIEQPLDVLLNKKSTAWKGLTLVAQKKCATESEAIKIIEATSNLIKRPVIEFNNKVLVGYDEATYADFFKK